MPVMREDAWTYRGCIYRCHEGELERYEYLSFFGSVFSYEYVRGSFPLSFDVWFYTDFGEFVHTGYLFRGPAAGSDYPGTAGFVPVV